MLIQLIRCWLFLGCVANAVVELLSREIVIHRLCWVGLFKIANFDCGHPGNHFMGSHVFSTTLAAATIAPSPMSILPRMVAPGPIKTPLRIFGWRSPLSFPVPPSVTDCMIETESSITAVSPITNPVAWSIITPLPMMAAGWMSTAKVIEILCCRSSASEVLPGATIRVRRGMPAVIKTL